MPKFRKKPVVIDAVRVADLDGQDVPPPWLAVALEHGLVVQDEVELRITTLEGVMVARREDWIIRGVHGELYPCKPEIFAATYVAADEPLDDVLNDHDRKAAIDQATRIANEAVVIEYPRGFYVIGDGAVRSYIRAILVAKIEAAILAEMYQRGEPRIVGKTVTEP